MQNNTKSSYAFFLSWIFMAVSMAVIPRDTENIHNRNYFLWHCFEYCFYTNMKKSECLNYPYVKSLILFSFLTFEPFRSKSYDNILILQ